MPIHCRRRIVSTRSSASSSSVKIGPAETSTAAEKAEVCDKPIVKSAFEPA